MIIILFYIGLFLLWIDAVVIGRKREFKNSLLFEYFSKTKSWFTYLIKSYENSKKFKKTSGEINKQQFPILDLIDVPEKNIIQTINQEDSVFDTDEIVIGEPIQENIEEVLNSSTIDRGTVLALTTEPFIMPHLTKLEQIQKRKSRDKKTNQMSLTFINKEAKEVQALKNKEIGELGEDYIMEYERRLLSDLNISYSPLHISKEFDGYGYDILSFDQYGKTKYIEVKTTTQDEKSEFFLSDNEFETMHRLENYFIYRLCNFNDLQKRKLIIINCKEEFAIYFELIPDTFKISKK